jgi:hypothetical protein
MISAVPSVSSVHVELDGRLPSTAGRTDETTKPTTKSPTFQKNGGDKIQKTQKEILSEGLRSNKRFVDDRGFEPGSVSWVIVFF